MVKFSAEDLRVIMDKKNKIMDKKNKIGNNAQAFFMSRLVLFQYLSSVLCLTADGSIHAALSTIGLLFQ
jgi:hypothetical protein